MDSRLVSDADARPPPLRRRIDGLRGTRHGRVALYVSSVALVAGAYYLAGRLGLELAYLDGAVAAVWPPAGVGLAVLFLYGVRLWPGIVDRGPAARGFLDAAGNRPGPDGRQHARPGGRRTAPAETDGRTRAARAHVRRVGSRPLRRCCSAGQRSVRADVAPPRRCNRHERPRARFSDLDLGRCGGRARICAGSADLGGHGCGPEFAGGTSWRAGLCSPCWWSWRSWRRSLTCRTSSSRCCSGRRCGLARAAQRWRFCRVFDHGLEHGA